jgi:hypothetical protein
VLGPDFRIELCLDESATPSRLIEALASLLLDRARKKVASEAGPAAPETLPSNEQKEK